MRDLRTPSTLYMHLREELCGMEVESTGPEVIGCTGSNPGSTLLAM